LIAVISDTDILSTFAKVGEMKLLIKTFGEIYISPAVFEELMVAANAGFSFVDNILEVIKIKNITNRLISEIKEFQSKHPQLGRGEIETMIIARDEGLLILTNDRVAKRICDKYSLNFLDLGEILRTMKIKDIVSKKGLISLIVRIEKDDRTIIKGKANILL